MPRKYLALLLLIPVLSHASPETPDDYSRRESACIGTHDEKCIAELRKQCASFGGKWLGETVGRGRQWGCERPTRDGGKRCVDSSQCESTCIAASTSRSNSEPSLSDCHCAATTVLPKGQPVFICTKEGIKAFHFD